MKYQEGDRIKTFIHDKKEQGVILSCINSDDPKDIRLQGFRYLVKLGCHQQVWSITENWLRKIPLRQKNEPGRDNNKSIR